MSYKEIWRKLTVLRIIWTVAYLGDEKWGGTVLSEKVNRMKSKKKDK